MTARTHPRRHVRHDGTARLLAWWTVTMMAVMVLMAVMRHG